MRTGSIGIGWQAGFWLATFIAFGFMLWLCSAVLPPFIVALILGYLLDPIVGRMERLGLSRTWATTIILVGAFVVVVLLVALLAPMIGRQLAEFIKAFPDLVKRGQALAAQIGDQFSNGYVSVLMKKVGLQDAGPSDLKGSISDIANNAMTWFGGFANSVLSHGAALLDVVSWIVIIPVVTFYLLVDWQRMIATIDALVPIRHRETVWSLVHEIDVALAGFLRGQSLVCLFLAIWYGVGLSIVGINFGLLIGVVGGVLSFIPYVGSLFVLVLALLIATIQGWPNWHLPGLALGVVLVGQFLESNVLSPKLVGDKVGLHPVWLIFALLAFGSVFGFTGLIVAVPVAAAAGVLLRFATRRYRESPFYTGEVPPQPTILSDQRGAA